MIARHTQYVLEHGSYYLYDVEDGKRSFKPRLMTDQVAIAYVVEDGYLLKHGSPDAVKKWHHENRRGHEIFGEVQVMTLPRGFPAEELTRALDMMNVKGMLERIEAGEVRLMEVEGPRQWRSG